MFIILYININIKYLYFKISRDPLFYMNINYTPKIDDEGTCTLICELDKFELC